MPHLSNRVTSTTRSSFGRGKRVGTQPIGIQPIRGGRKSTLPVSISGGLGGSRLPNIRSKGNLGAQVSALKRL